MARPPSGRISTRARRRTVAAADAAQPAVDYGFGPGRVPRTSSSQVDPAPRAPRVPRPRLPLAAAPSASRAPTPVPTVPIPSDRDRAESLGLPLLGLSNPSELPPRPLRPIWTPSALLPNYTFVVPLRVIRPPTGKREQRAEPTRFAAIQYIAHRSLSAFCLTPAPPLLGDPRARWQRPPPYYRRGRCPPRPQSKPGPPLLTACGARGLPFKRRTNPYLRAATHAPLDHASLPFDCSLPSRHGTHTSHARAFLCVDRNEHMHPLVVAPLLEVPSAGDTATDGSMADRLDSPPSGAGHCGKRGLFWAVAGHAPG